MNGSDAHQQDHQIDKDGDGERNQCGPGDGFFGGLDLLGNRCDQVVAFKGDEGQPHGNDNACGTVRQKGGEAGRCLAGDLKDPLQPVRDKDAQDNDLGHGDDIFDAAGKGGAAHIDEDENDAHQRGHHQCRGFVTCEVEDQVGDRGEISLNKFPEVAAESERVEGAGNDVAKPEHPTRGEPRRPGECLGDK